MRDYPALCVTEATKVTTDEIVHSESWHRNNFHCERPWCHERIDIRYGIRYLDRLQRPGRDAGVAPIVEMTRAWVDTITTNLPGVPIDTFVDCSGGDYAPTFREALAGSRSRLTCVEMTAQGQDPGHAVGQAWLRVSRTRLLMNLERRFDNRAIEMPRAIFDVLRKELFTMRRTVTDARNVQFLSGPNDDLVVAAALSTWAEPWPLRGVGHGPAEMVWG